MPPLSVQGRNSAGLLRLGVVLPSATGKRQPEFFGQLSQSKRDQFLLGLLGEREERVVEFGFV